MSASTGDDHPVRDAPTSEEVLGAESSSPKPSVTSVPSVEEEVVQRRADSPVFTCRNSSNLS